MEQVLQKLFAQIYVTHILAAIFCIHIIQNL